MAKLSSVYGGKPFDEAVSFFRDKVNLPTRHWDDLMRGMHARAFVVAGATRDALITDLRSAVDKAITKGTTLAEFRKDFSSIVEKHGWPYKGGKNWRTRIIYETNLRTAYHAGRYKQMKDPDVVALRPYWQYRHGGSVNPRKQHLGWDGMVLSHDDPIWTTIYPPNGWGCSCSVRTLSKRELTRMGKTEPDKAPELEYRDWTDRDGKVHRIPKGIDPGWDYNVGEASWGKRLAAEEKAYWDGQKRNAWETLTPGNYKSKGRPEIIPLDQSSTRIKQHLPSNRSNLKEQIELALGGKQKVTSFNSGDFSWDLVSDADFLAAHLDPARAKYMPFLLETLADPFEIWASFEQHRGTGKIVLRHRIIKAFGKTKKGMLVVANANKGMMTGYTVIPVRQMKYLNNQRYGELIWARD